MDAPIISIENKNNNRINNYENKNETKNENKTYKFVEENQKLYQIIFSKKLNYIKIKCNDTNNENDIYTKKLFFDECKQSNKYLDFLGNISVIYDLIKKMNNKNFVLKNQNNLLNLTINFIHLDQNILYQFY